MPLSFSKQNIHIRNSPKVVKCQDIKYKNPFKQYKNSTKSSPIAIL